MDHPDYSILDKEDQMRLKKHSDDWLNLPDVEKDQ